MLLNTLYDFNLVNNSTLDTIVSDVINTINSMYSSAINIVQQLTTDFTSVLLEPNNPYTDTSNLYKWYNKYNIDTLPTKDLLLQIFNEFISQFTSSHLYINTKTILNKYNNLNTNKDIIHYVMDQIVYTHNLESILESISSMTNSEIYNYICTLYQNNISDIENKLILIDESDTNSTQPKLYLKIKDLMISKPLPFAWINDIGHFIIDYIELEMNGQRIDRLNGEWLHIWNQLHMPLQKQNGNNKLIGNVSSLTTFNTFPKDKYTLYISLPFWFCRHIESSLPLIALHYTPILLRIKFKSLQDICYSTELNNVSLDGYIIGDYIYVETAERETLSKNKHEYLIDSVIPMEVVIDNTKLIQDTIQIPFQTKNICKEIIWTVQTISKQIQKKYTDFTYNNKNPCTYALIKYNGRDRDQCYIEYFNYITPYKAHTSIPNMGINVYTYSLYPELLQPSGIANFSKIDTLELILTLQNDLLNAIKQTQEVVTVHIYLYNMNILRIMSGLSGLLYYE
jgi:hypothetical protein